MHKALSSRLVIQGVHQRGHAALSGSSSGNSDCLGEGQGKGHGEAGDAKEKMRGAYGNGSDKMRGSHGLKVRK